MEARCGRLLALRPRLDQALQGPWGWDLCCLGVWGSRRYRPELAFRVPAPIYLSPSHVNCRESFNGVGRLWLYCSMFYLEVPLAGGYFGPRLSPKHLHRPKSKLLGMVLQSACGTWQCDLMAWQLVRRSLQSKLCAARISKIGS